MVSLFFELAVCAVHCIKLRLKSWGICTFFKFYCLCDDDECEKVLDLFLVFKVVILSRMLSLPSCLGSPL